MSTDHSTSPTTPTRHAAVAVLTGAPDGWWCPECAEPAQPVPPVHWGMPEFLSVPRFSHRDGTPLCPVYRPAGVVPADLVPNPPGAVS